MHVAAIHVAVRCFATLHRFQPATPERHPLPEGATAADLIRDLGIPPADVTILFVNGQHAEPDRVLADGDRVGLFPPVGGG